MEINLELIFKLLGSFLIGAIPFSPIAMLGSGTDLRDIGSGNPGFNNVLRVDKRRAVLALIGDVGKGWLPVWLFYDPAQFVNYAWLYALCTVFGHCYSPFLKFQGGKGIATGAGAMLAIYPLMAVGSGAFFLVVRILGSRLKLSEGGAIASLSSWVFFTVLMHLQFGMPHTKYSALMSLFLFWRHKDNLRRMVGL